MLFTIAQEDFPKIKGNPNLTVIGHMSEKQEGRRLITRAGTAVELQARGWNAFGENP